VLVQEEAPEPPVTGWHHAAQGKPQCITLILLITVSMSLTSTGSSRCYA
jgi:hypothetical protein